MTDNQEQEQVIAPLPADEEVIGEEHLEEDSGQHQVPEEFIRSPFQMGDVAEPLSPFDAEREAEQAQKTAPLGVAPLPAADETEGVVLDSGPQMPQFKRQWLLAVPALLMFCCCSWAGGLLFGWYGMPVEWDATEWRGATVYNLQAGSREDFLVALADLHAFDNNDARVHEALDGEGMLQDICGLMQHRVNDNRMPEAARLMKLSEIMGGCALLESEVAGDEIQSAATD
jgi:hypothetical protein